MQITNIKTYADRNIKIYANGEAIPKYLELIIGLNTAPKIVGGIDDTPYSKILYAKLAGLPRMSGGLTTMPGKSNMNSSSDLLIEDNTTRNANERNPIRAPAKGRSRSNKKEDFFMLAPIYKC